MSAIRAKNAAVGNAIAKLNATQLLTLANEVSALAAKIANVPNLPAGLADFEDGAKDALRIAFGVTSGS